MPAESKERLIEQSKISEEPIQQLICKELLLIGSEQFLHPVSNGEVVDLKTGSNALHLFIFFSNYINSLTLIQATSIFQSGGYKSLMRFYKTLTITKNQVLEESEIHRKAMASKKYILLNILQCRWLLQKDPTCSTIFTFVSKNSRYSGDRSQLGIESARKNFAECYSALTA